MQGVKKGIFLILPLLHMALKLSSIVSSAVVRRRLPLVGAFCVLSFGLSNLCPSISFTSNTGCVQSLPFASLISSKVGGQTHSHSRIVHSSARMEADTKTVPSIVVYVTVPNKKAGKKLAESIVKERLAACVNRVPDGIAGTSLPAISMKQSSKKQLMRWSLVA